LRFRGKGEEKNFFLGVKDFFLQGGGGVFKSRLCLRFGGEGGRGGDFFSGGQGFFLQGGEEVSKVVFA
jgi:hypothetical protein